MEEDADSANWVIVDKTDCAEETTFEKPPVTVDETEYAEEFTSEDLPVTIDETDCPEKTTSKKPSDTIDETECAEEFTSENPPVTVDEHGCAEKITSENLPVITCPATRDSDQESEGSISILSDHPTDSYSEEETETNINAGTVKIMPIIKIQTELDEQANEGTEDKIPDSEALDQVEEQHIKNVVQDLPINHQTSDDDSFPTTDSFSKKWTFVEEKSKHDVEMPKNKFFLDCSQEPILEVSANNTDVETESTISTPECQAIVKKEDIPLTSISNRDIPRDRDIHLNRISIGFLISVLILTSSHLIRQYLDCSEEGVHSPNPTSSFIESITEKGQENPIVNYCLNRQKEKGGTYSEQAVEKCVTKRLKKKNREQAIKKTEIYLQMKERVLELREKELAEKEKEILKSLKKRTSNTYDENENKKKRKYENKFKEDSSKTSKEFDKKNKIKLDKEKSQEDQEWKNSNIKFKNKASWKNNAWTFQTAKGPIKLNAKMFTKDESNNKKMLKKDDKYKDLFKNFKNKVKEFHKDKSKSKFKDVEDYKKGDSNEEWYIKYNPVKNTIELINITTLPKQDSFLIRNGNKTINGQWYFSLYGSARSSFRNKEKAAEWYFKRAHFRENKRDKAKWYFDYMYERDNARYFY